MSKEKRNHKKEVARLFSRSFDQYRLDYATRVKPIKSKAMMFGFGTAGALYLAFYIATYMAYSKGALTDDYLNRLVWVLMVPTTVVGMLVWQISKNRMEYPIRQDIRRYMTELEANSGLLWRFYPLWQVVDGGAGGIKKAFTESERCNVDKIEIEDYTDAVKRISRYLATTEFRDIPDEPAEATVQNFSK